MSAISFYLFLIFAYLLGSLSSAILICLCLNLPDPRTSGSLNPGATNVLRIGGKIPALITLLGDAIKGWLPVSLGAYFSLDPHHLILILLAAFLGHLFPLFFNFKGGKGVATFLGGTLAFSLSMGSALLVTWAVIALLFRYSSLASLLIALLAPCFAAYFTHDLYITIVIGFMSILLIYRHRRNIINLMNGKENHLGSVK